ncbi:MAG: sensor histidine kinase [Flavisolibacter sp.]
MLKIRNIKWLPILMGLTILGIAGFQYYWLEKAFEREKRNIEMRTSYLFRESIYNLQAEKLKLDRLVGDSSTATKILVDRGRAKEIRMRPGPDDKMINMVDVLIQKAKDSSGRAYVIKGADTMHMSLRRNRLMQFVFDVESIQDTIRVREVKAQFGKRLDKENINIPFTVSRIPTPEKDERVPNVVTLGFSNPITYHLELGNPSGFLLKRILAPILFSVFLIGFTILSFSLLYRNLLRQRRLADIKNEFISNITHELKTPIATVSVAIEALRSFNANMDPQRTKEYLDISANELQRLSLLVDKVLKLSMFEKREIELKYEELDMKEMVKEVTSSMRLQFEKHHAQVNVNANGDTNLKGDRLHLVSVIFNLLDNALKYSNGKPVIGIDIKTVDNKLLLNISDTGIGIPAEYQGKVFEKFFRVPTGNLHNAKGYGLGLSYVAHVINRHKGTIKVDSAEGNGTTFSISLPKHN